MNKIFLEVNVHISEIHAEGIVLCDVICEL
jgi:hypothetical protein